MPYTTDSTLGSLTTNSLTLPACKTIARLACEMIGNDDFFNTNAQNAFVQDLVAAVGPTAAFDAICRQPKTELFRDRFSTRLKETVSIAVENVHGNDKVIQSLFFLLGLSFIKISLQIDNTTCNNHFNLFSSKTGLFCLGRLH
jgi:hypothetical protein